MLAITAYGQINTYVQSLIPFFLFISNIKFVIFIIVKNAVEDYDI